MQIYGVFHHCRLLQENILTVTFDESGSFGTRKLGLASVTSVRGM